MIKGVGTDILEISRMEKMIVNNRFMSRFFTENEREYIFQKANNVETAAAIFCAKEAVAKAIGTGFLKFMPGDIEILHENNGMPRAVLAENAQRVAELKGISHIAVSLSHCRDYAVAFAVAEGDESI